jgi:hypothetical protein
VAHIICVDDENCVLGILNRLISDSSGSCWYAVLTFRFKNKNKKTGKCMAVLLDIVHCLIYRTI